MRKKWISLTEEQKMELSTPSIVIEKERSDVGPTGGTGDEDSCGKIVAFDTHQAKPSHQSPAPVLLRVANGQPEYPIV